MFSGKELSPAGATFTTTKIFTSFGEQENYSHEQLVTIAKCNQKHQQKRSRTQQKRKVTTKQQPKQQLSPQRRKEHTKQPKDTKCKKRGKRRQNQNPNESFLSKSRAAALQQTKLHMEKQTH